MLRLVAASQVRGFLAGSSSLAAAWALLMSDCSKSDFPLPQGQKQKNWRENTTGPAQNMLSVLALPWHGQGKANSPELKALRQFSMYFPKDGPFLSGFLACGEEPALWHRQSGDAGGAAPVPAGLEAAGGLQYSHPAHSSCCIPPPEALSGNLQGSQCPAVDCQNSEKKNTHHSVVKEYYISIGWFSSGTSRLVCSFNNYFMALWKCFSCNSVSEGFDILGYFCHRRGSQDDTQCVRYQDLLIGDVLLSVMHNVLLAIISEVLFPHMPRAIREECL